MTNEEFKSIIDFQNEIISIRKINDSLLERISSNLYSDELPVKINIQNEKLTFECFGHEVYSKNKIVKLDEDHICFEYRFIVSMDDKEIEIWKFYLDSEGVLTCPDRREDKFCDFQNREIAKEICCQVMLGLKDSKVFQAA